MQSEMLAILTAYFLYHGDAGWGWWCLFVLVCFLYILQGINKACKQQADDVAESLAYWEKK